MRRSPALRGIMAQHPVGPGIWGACVKPGSRRLSENCHLERKGRLHFPVGK